MKKTASLVPAGNLFLMYFIYIVTDNRGEKEIPDDVIRLIAEALIPGIITFFESDKGKAEFEKWKTEQNCQKATSEKMEKNGENSPL